MKKGESITIVFVEGLKLSITLDSFVSFKVIVSPSKSEALDNPCIIESVKVKGSALNTSIFVKLDEALLVATPA